MRVTTWIAACVRAINNALRYIQYVVFITTLFIKLVKDARRDITIKGAIKYAIT